MALIRRGDQRRGHWHGPGPGVAARGDGEAVDIIGPGEVWIPTVLPDPRCSRVVLLDPHLVNSGSSTTNSQKYPGTLRQGLG